MIGFFVVFVKSDIRVVCDFSLITAQGMAMERAFRSRWLARAIILMYYYARVWSLWMQT